MTDLTIPDDFLIQLIDKETGEKQNDVRMGTLRTMSEHQYRLWRKWLDALDLKPYIEPELGWE